MRIRLQPVNKPSIEFDASPVYSVLVAAMRAGVEHRHDCGGKAQCGTCRVRVLSGTVSSPDAAERARLEAVVAGPAERLACRMRPASDLVLEAVLPVRARS